MVISLTTKDHEYRIFRFPPGVCLPDEEMLFYSTVLKVDIMVGIGVGYLIIIFWIISRVCHNNVFIVININNDNNNKLYMIFI